MIGDSVHQVEAGYDLVNAAGATMDEIDDSISRVTEIMADISAASAEQGGGIEQVNRAVMQMDQVTQQNAALVEEAAAAAEAMQDHAARLSEVVSVFRLQAGEEQAGSRTGAARRPTAGVSSRAVATRALH